MCTVYVTITIAHVLNRTRTCTISSHTHTHQKNAIAVHFIAPHFRQIHSQAHESAVPLLLSRGFLRRGCICGGAPGSTNEPGPRLEARSDWSYASLILHTHASITPSRQAAAGRHRAAPDVPVNRTSEEAFSIRASVLVCTAPVSRCTHPVRHRHRRATPRPRPRTYPIHLMATAAPSPPRSGDTLGRPQT